MTEDYETWDIHMQEHEKIYEEIQKLRKTVMIQAIVELIIIILIVFIVLTLIH